MNQPTPVPQKSNSTLWIVLAIVGVLFLCCCSCSTIFGLFGYLKTGDECIYEGPMYSGDECTYYYDDYYYDYDY